MDDLSFVSASSPSAQSSNLTPTAEQRLSRALRVILADLPDGGAVPEGEQFQTVLTGLAWFIPGVLAEVYPEWEREALDGVYSHTATRPGHEQVEILGICIFLSDQTVAPIHLRLQIAPSSDEVSWFECRVGEKAEQEMVRLPYTSIRSLGRRLSRLEGRVHAVDWFYRATFGERRGYLV